MLLSAYFRRPMPTTKDSLLSIVPYRVLPASHGGHWGIVSLHDHLGRICADHLVCTNNNSGHADYSFHLHPVLPASPLRYLPYVGLKKMKQIATEQQVRFVFCDHPYMAPSAIRLADGLKIPWFLRSHNIESERFRAIGKKWWPAMRLLEGYVMRRAAGIFFITPEERDWAIRHYHLPESKAHFVPYGTLLHQPPLPAAAIKTQIAQVLHANPDIPWLYFLGTQDYLPNAQATEKIITEVYPRLKAAAVNVQIFIVGRGLAAHLQEAIAATNGDIRYTGFIPDLHDFLQSVALMLNPVLLGGGIKTKMVEALGYNKPVVSTVSGAEGILPQVCGQNLLITPDGDWDAFVQAILQMLDRLPQQPVIPAAFYQNYYWGNIAQNMYRIMDATAQQAGRLRSAHTE
jgi:glycosyltransferase involved in cell wall biosynthesis